MSAQPISASALTPLHVLLVEDTPTDARLIQATLRPPSFEVTHVERLSDAMAVLRSARVDVVLLDLMLPDSNGAETLDSVRVEAAGTAIVVITGNERAALDAASRGAQDYLIKGGANAETIVRSVRYAFERSRADARLRASEERFRALIENGSDGVALVDREGIILYSSPAVTRILGYSPEEIGGTDFMTLIHPDDAAEASERFEAILANRFGLTFQRDLRYRHRDGTWRYLEVLSVNRLDDPAVRAIVANYRDVTERRDALEVTDQLRRRYEAILNSIADGVHGLDSNGNIAFENSAAAAMLGWEGPDLIGRPAHETIHHSRTDGTPHHESECPILATLTDGIVRRVSDDVFWRSDGTPFHVDYVVAPELDSEGRKRGVVVAFRDITKQQEMQRQVDQALRISSLGRVAASVAHEFNNVLLVIQPFAEILGAQAGHDALLRKPVKHILDAVKRGRAVSNQILRFASPAEPHLKLIDLCQWTRDFSEEAHLVLRDRKLEVKTQQSLMIQADTEQLSQVMINLVRNARDASGAGSVITVGAAAAATISFLREELAEPHRYAAVFVRDAGEGIPPETLSRIFEPLFTTKRNGGTGLGLAVVHQIVSEHGGRILVESEPGLGSTFYIVLPFEEEPFQLPEAGGEIATMCAAVDR
jgi:PAS domain S-box-containing protein